MAPTHPQSEDVFDKPPTELADAGNVHDQVAAHGELIYQYLKSFEEQTIQLAQELQRSAAELDKFELTESMLQDLIDNFKDFTNIEAKIEILAVGDNFAAFQELASAVIEDLPNTAQDTEDTNQPLDTSDYNLFADLLDHNISQTSTGCHLQAVAARHLQADCHVTESDVYLARQFEKCDGLAYVNAFETGFLAGTCSVLFIMAIMLRAAFRLLREPLVRFLALVIIWVYLVILVGGF